MDDLILTQIDDHGRVVQQNKTTGQHRFLFEERHQTFTSFEDFVDYLYHRERIAPWRGEKP